MFLHPQFECAIKQSHNITFYFIITLQMFILEEDVVILLKWKVTLNILWLEDFVGTCYFAQYCID